VQSSFHFIDKETSFYATPLVSQKQRKEWTTEEQ